MMALELPDIRKEKVVLFHLQSVDSGDDVVLQIPPKQKRKQSDTFTMDLSTAEHYAWMRGLNEGKTLIDRLRLNGHVAYFPASGKVVSLEDKSLEKMTIVQEARELAELENNEGPLNRWSDFPVGVKQTRYNPFRGNIR